MDRPRAHRLFCVAWIIPGQKARCATCTEAWVCVFVRLWGVPTFTQPCRRDQTCQAQSIAEPGQSRSRVTQANRVPLPTCESVLGQNSICMYRIWLGPAGLERRLAPEEDLMGLTRAGELGSCGMPSTPQHTITRHISLDPPSFKVLNSTAVTGQRKSRQPGLAKLILNM